MLLMERGHVMRRRNDRFKFSSWILIAFFMLVSVAANFSDKNTLVYGHNMKNESMFGLLKKYEEEDFFQNNSGFYICTPDACDYYNIFSCHLSKKDEMEDFLQTEFGEEQTFQEFVNGVEVRSIYDTGIKVDVEQNIVTLVTCSTTGNEYRFFIHATKKTS